MTCTFIVHVSRKNREWIRVFRKMEKDQLFLLSKLIVCSSHPSLLAYDALLYVVELLLHRFLHQRALYLWGKDQIRMAINLGTTLTVCESHAAHLFSWWSEEQERRRRVLGTDLHHHHHRPTIKACKQQLFIINHCPFFSPLSNSETLG